MSDVQTSSSNGSTGEKPSSSSSNGSNSGEKVKIQVAGIGGGFSLDEFNRASGKETDNVDERDEPEVEEGSGELKDNPEEATEDPIIPDDGDEDEGDEEEKPKKKEEDAADDSEDSEGEEGDLDELSKNTKKGIKAFTKDGKALNLPPDLEILQTVDGETRKINLRDHINVVAGELTVNARLGKVASFREQVEQGRREIQAVHSKFQEDIQTLVSFAKEGKPDLAICFLAEMNGISPIQMKKQFLKTLVAEAQKFEGKTEVEIDNYYLNLESQWRDRKEKKQKEKLTQQEEVNRFLTHATAEIKKENLSNDEFSAAQKLLRENGELEGLSRDESLDRVIEHALLTKHVNMAKTAVQNVDPKLAQNKKLIDLLLECTHPNRFTVDEMADVVREYLGKTTTRIASNLSKKVSHQPMTARSEKQNGAGKKQKTYRSQGDLQTAFGL